MQTSSVFGTKIERFVSIWWGTPLNVAARTPEAASAAMGATMFHWGLHPWAIYAVTALALAFFAFNKGMPLTIRSTFYPLLGEKTWKLPGDIIDVVAVMATIFGLATSLGFGARQAGSGLNFLFGIESTIGLQVVIIIAVTSVAVISIREFLIAVLLVPTVLTVIWMQAFGGNALLQIQTNMGALSKGLEEVSLATFQMLANLPLTQITSFFGIVLVLVFFVTSSDSGSLVVDSITAGGKLDAPIPQRVFWAVMEGAIAAALLVGGGADALGAIQAVAVTVGLPFTAVMLVMIVSTYLGVSSENLADYRSPSMGLAKTADQTAD